ncbi:MAG: nitrophenyl compound nitroreductase subunit ArsF family protein [Bacteroidota bacterium]
MRTLKSLIVSLFIVVFVFSGNSEAFAFSKEENEKTKVYYFHNTRRCPTCMAIEKETKKVLKEQPYMDTKESGELEFKMYNAENAANKTLVKELEVTGSALLILKGEEKIDLTSKAFMYALSQPEKFRQALRDALND